MKLDTQIVFFHKGKSWYLPYVLHQAKFVSPNSDIVLLGDDLSFEGIHVEPLGLLHSIEIDQFRESYVHMSPNSVEFETLCWMRWFYLLNYMRKYEVESVLHLDSDVLLYSSIETIHEAYSDLKWDCAFCIPKQDPDSFIWAASAHMSYWTIESLSKLCTLILESFRKDEYLNRYQQKWEWHQSRQEAEGVHDMTTLYFFWQENEKNIINLAKSHEGHVFDHNMNISWNYELDEYQMESSMKKVEFSEDHPFFIKSHDSQKKTQVHALHFQGMAKNNIKKFYQGESFSGKTYSDIRSSLSLGKNKLKGFLKAKNELSFSMKITSYFKKFKTAFKNTSNLAILSEQQSLMLGRILTETIASKKKINTLDEVEFQVFSQWGDDGIIQWLIKNLEFSHETFVEFGVEDYQESNTRFLMMNNNWSGLVMDGSPSNVERIRTSDYFWKYNLSTKAVFIDTENINQLLSSSELGEEIGILHIDLDGNDYWIWQIINVISPTVVILEYNSLLGIDRALTIPYDKNFSRNKAHHSNLYFGASLRALHQLSTDKGYSFIGCNSAGNNAYFVRKDKLNNTVREVSLEDGYVVSKFRESRDKEGRLNYLTRKEKIEAIRGMPVYNVETHQIEEL